MKKIILLSAFMLVVIWAKAQVVKVYDKSTLQPVNGAVLSGNKNKEKVLTDAKGKADVSAFVNCDTVFVTNMGYYVVAMPYSKLIAEKEVYLSQRSYDINEVIVSANRFEEVRNDVPRQVQVLNSREIQSANASSTADLIQSSGNVTVQKSQMGGGSPIIRGFEANKVLIVVDGVRMNNAIYRAGHLQSIITLDNSILERSEIVFGPGSVVYGSDALGGVMHFYTKDPVIAGENEKVHVSAGAYTRYSSASNERSGHVDFNIGLKKLAFLSSVTYSDFGDLRQGAERNPFYGDFGKCLYYAERINGQDSMVENKDVNIQKRSGYSQYDVMEKILFRQNEHTEHILNIQMSMSSDINRYDRLSEVSGGKLKYAEWYYGPQKRTLASYMFKWNGESSLFDQARVILSWQDLEESRNDRKFGKSDLNHRTENVTVTAVNADLCKEKGEHEIRYGIDINLNKVSSTAYTEVITDGTEKPLSTRYPDGGSDMNMMAAYLTHAWEISDKLIVSDGIRFTSVSLNSKFNDTIFYPLPYRSVEINSSAANGNVGITYLPGYDWRFALSGSTGFRAPNVDDMTKIFESVPGKVVVPNDELKPEYTWNGELIISKLFSKKIRTEITGFYTLYDNVITLANTTFNGSDSVMYDGEMSKAVSMQNKEQAYIYGCSAALYADVTENFSIVSTLNYTYGRIKTDTTDYPLDHIAPVFGRTSFVLNLKRFTGQVYLVYSGWKKIEDYNLVGEDNIAYATANGMPGWNTLNLSTGWQLNRYLKIQFAVENILDRNYRVFASGISAPGRNFIISLRGQF